MSAEREAQRQHALLSAVRRETALKDLQPWLRSGDGERGLRAYQATAGALAERALAAAYPTVRQLISDDSFAALARDFWHRHPPLTGDVALWGGELPAFLAAAPSLADTPYLADVARLEWAVHEAERAADPRPAQGLELLATHDPQNLHLRLSAGTAVIASPHPIAALWHAHRSQVEDRFAFDQTSGETARITRQGLKAHVEAVDAETATFTAALLANVTLGEALDAAGPHFNFEAWLITALRSDQIAAVTLPSA